MDEPTIAELLEAITARVASDYIDCEVIIQNLRTDDALWLRHPDWDCVLKVSIERLPRESTPD